MYLGMNRKSIITILLKSSLVLVGLMLFIKLKPIYQIIPVVILVLASVVLITIEMFEREKLKYNRIKKKKVQ